MDSGLPTLLNQTTFYREPENKTKPFAKISLVGSHGSESIGRAAKYVALDRSAVLVAALKFPQRYVIIIPLSVHP